MHKTGIVTLHPVPSSNALRFAFDTSSAPQTRLMLLLQNAAFVPLFRAAAGKLPDVRIDKLEPAPPPAGDDALADIFTTASHDRPAAARKTLAYLDQNGHPNTLMNQARRLVFLKGND